MTRSMTESAVCLFLSGADMDPTKVRAAYPAAHFVARARVSARSEEIALPFAVQLGADGARAEVWGILIEQPGGNGASGELRQATTDDGRAFEAVLAGAQRASGQPADVVAAARYWELPPAYVGKLRAAIAVAEDEPSDDGE
jgi:hypothetical protein